MRRRSTAKVLMTITVVSALCAVLRLLSVNGIAADSAITELVAQDGVAERLLSLELSTRSFGSILVSAFFAPPSSPETPELTPPDSVATPDEFFKSPKAPIQPPAPAPGAAPSIEENDSGELFYQGGEVSQDTGINNSAPLPSDGIIMQNTSGLELDITQLLSEPLDIKLAGEGPQVLVIHTHASEAYTQLPGEQYVESDPYRTQDKSKSIIYVGDVLSEELAARGVSVIHDRGTYDYPRAMPAHTTARLRRYVDIWRNTRQSRLLSTCTVTLARQRTATNIKPPRKSVISAVRR